MTEPINIDVTVTVPEMNATQAYLQLFAPCHGIISVVVFERGPSDFIASFSVDSPTALRLPHAHAKVASLRAAEEWAIGVARERGIELRSPGSFSFMSFSCRELKPENI